MADKKFNFSTVLLVDDSDIDVLVNRRLMEITYFAERIIVTTSGEEALQYLKEECTSTDNIPDWILLDMYLPEMSGYDFLEEFKKLPEPIVSHTKIVILSVYQKAERLRKALEFPFVYGRFEKPLTQQALLDLAAGRPLPTNASS